MAYHVYIVNKETILALQHDLKSPKLHPDGILCNTATCIVYAKHHTF